jgi:hypothetical protein
VAEHGGHGRRGVEECPIGLYLDVSGAASSSEGRSRARRMRKRGESTAGAVVRVHGTGESCGGAGAAVAGCGVLARRAEAKWTGVRQSELGGVKAKARGAAGATDVPPGERTGGVRPRGGHGLRTVGAAAFRRERGSGASAGEKRAGLACASGPKRRRRPVKAENPFFFYNFNSRFSKLIQN